MHGDLASERSIRKQPGSETVLVYEIKSANESLGYS